MVCLRPRALSVLCACALFVFTTASVNHKHQHILAQHTPHAPAKIEEYSSEHTLALSDSGATPSDDYPLGGFTLIIATYKRTSILEKQLHHLLHPSPPPSLAQIVIVWQNVGLPLPSFLQPEALEALAAETGMGVYVRLSKRNSMNERFRPLLDWGHLIETRAVMILDDDVVLRKDTIEWGWHEWTRVNPAHHRRTERGGRLVGFTGRDFRHNEALQGRSKWEYVLQPEDKYGLVLTNAAWLRTEWLERYWQRKGEMKDLRAYVDKVANCDDLLLNFLAANLSHSAPLLLQPTVPLRTVPSLGIWNSATDGPASLDSSSAEDDPAPQAEPAPAAADHFTLRAQCLAHFFQHFAQYAPEESKSDHWPLRRTDSAVTQDLRDRARVLAEGEAWEGREWERRHSRAAQGAAQDDGGDSADEGEEVEEEDEDDISEQYHREWEELLHDMTEEEVQDLMLTLAEHEAQHADEHDDGDDEQDEEEEEEEEEGHEEKDGDEEDAQEGEGHEHEPAHGEEGEHGGEGDGEAEEHADEQPEERNHEEGEQEEEQHDEL